jgi:hypothetical protein
MPGDYTLRLTAGGKSTEQNLQVREDPRLQVSPADRKAWTDALLSVADMYRAAVGLLERVNRESVPPPNDVRRISRELQSRLVTLYRDMSQSTATPTSDQQAQMLFFKSELESLRRRAPP